MSTSASSWGQCRSSLAKSQAYREVLIEMGDEIQKASQSKDSDRLHELAGHLGTVLMQGLVPNLESARREIPAGSQDERVLRQLRDATDEVVKSILTNIPEATEGKDARLKILEAGKRVEAVK